MGSSSCIIGYWDITYYYYAGGVILYEPSVNRERYRDFVKSKVTQEAKTQLKIAACVATASVAIQMAKFIPRGKNGICEIKYA